MKKAIVLVISMLLSILIAGSASALSTTYNDDYSNWPGWPKAPNPVNPSDTIGSFPTITSLTVNSSGGYLQSIAVSVTNLRHTETLFINADYKMGESYEAWDYFAGYGMSPKFYSVAANYDYILVQSPQGAHWRDGHPFGIENNDLTEVLNTLKSVTYAGGILTYTFYDNIIVLGERYAIGMSVDCGNDVFMTPVPEPTVLMLLGIGLIGVAAARRRT